MGFRQKNVPWGVQPYSHKGLPRDKNEKVGKIRDKNVKVVFPYETQRPSETFND
jgi:hypothetical protein